MNQLEIFSTTIGTEVTVGLIGLCVTIVGGLVYVMKGLFDQNNTTLRENNKSNVELAKAITKLSHSSDEQIKADRERHQQNLEFQKKIINKLDLIDNKTDRNLKAVKSINVERQIVGEQIVIRDNEL